MLQQSEQKNFCKILDLGEFVLDRYGLTLGMNAEQAEKYFFQIETLCNLFGHHLSTLAYPTGNMSVVRIYTDSEIHKVYIECAEYKQIEIIKVQLQQNVDPDWTSGNYGKWGLEKLIGVL